MNTVPLTVRRANAVVLELHRHHKPVRGHRFSIGAEKQGRLIGAAIVGRPVSREYDPERVAEVSRLVTDGTKNACSFLYGASARIAKEMGFERIQTYILESEPGTSLEAAGWEYEATTAGGSWASSKRYAAQGRRNDQPQCPKKRYAKQLRCPTA